MVQSPNLQFHWCYYPNDCALFQSIEHSDIYPVFYCIQCFPFVLVPWLTICIYSQVFPHDIDSLGYSRRMPIWEKSDTSLSLPLPIEARCVKWDIGF